MLLWGADRIESCAVKLGVLISAFALLCLIAGDTLAAGIEGTYGYGGKESVTIRIVAGKGEGEFVGVVASGTSDWHRRLVGMTVLELKQVAEGKFRGRCNAYHVRWSDDMTAWLGVPEAQLLATGDLRCTLTIPDEGSVAIVYQRLAAGDQPLAAHDANDLAGDWKLADGASLHFGRQGEAYVGTAVKLLDLAKESEEGPMSLRKVADGLYRGTVETKGQKEEIEITVQGGKLACVRTGKDGARVRTTAKRVSKYSGGSEPARAPKPIEPDLAGVWASPDGDVTRYSRNGDAYAGVVVKLSPYRQRYGFRAGEETIRLKRVQQGYYVGKVKVKTAGGRDEWWEDIEVAVEVNRLSFTRITADGEKEKGTAARVGGL